MFNPPSSRSEAIEQIVKQRCGVEFPGVTWEEMNAAVAASPISEEDFAFECPEVSVIRVFGSRARLI